MKGAKLIIIILTLLALALATVMVSLNIYPSWSQYARSLEEPLLIATLSAISSIFLIRSFTFRDRFKLLYNIKGVSIRIEHLNRLTGFLFIGVLCTPVTHPVKLIQILHFTFTFVAIVSAFSEIIFYNKNLFSYIASALGFLGFVLAFTTGIYSIGLGELIAASVIAGNILYHRNKIESDENNKNSKRLARR